MATCSSCGAASRRSAPPAPVPRYRRRCACCPRPRGRSRRAVAAGGGSSADSHALLTCSALYCFPPRSSILARQLARECLGRELDLAPAPAAHELVEIGAADPQLAAGVERPELALIEPAPDRPG